MIMVLNMITTITMAMMITLDDDDDCDGNDVPRVSPRTDLGQERW